MRCTNGGCTKPTYRGTECFRCWCGTKWDSMKARVENRAGRYDLWSGKELGFTRREFIEWAMLNPPPKEMVKPSVDRIDSELGYTFSNIRWLEASQNSRGPHRGIPLDVRYCTQCKQYKTLNTDNFGTNSGNRQGFQSYCIECRRAYNRSRYAGLRAS